MVGSIPDWKQNSLEPKFPKNLSPNGKAKHLKPKIKYTIVCEICKTEISKYYLKEHMLRIHKISLEGAIENKKKQPTIPAENLVEENVEISEENSGENGDIVENLEEPTENDQNGKPVVPSPGKTFYSGGKYYCSLCFANDGKLIEFSEHHICKYDSKMQQPISDVSIYAKMSQNSQKPKSKPRGSYKPKHANNVNLYDMPKGYYLPADKGYCDICEKAISKYYMKDHMLRKHQIDYNPKEYKEYAKQCAKEYARCVCSLKNHI